MLDRRKFIQNSAVGALTLASVGVIAGCTSEQPQQKPADNEQANADTKSSADTTPKTDTAKTPNRVCEILGIEKPVIQASMTFLTDATLVAAVSNAGGMGILGTNAGQSGPAASPAEGVENMRKEIQKTKELTDKPFGVAWSDADGFLEMLQDEGISIVFFLGMASIDNDYFVDEEKIAMLKDEGFTVLYRDVNPTVGAMVAAQNAGADIVIASGYGNGGHMPESRVTIMSLVQEAKGKITVPLMASGNIATGDVAGALAQMGIEGVYCGTRFNVTEESPCSKEAKQAIIDARAEELVEFRGILGFVRTNRSPFSEECVAMSDSGASRMDLSAKYTPMFLNGMRLGKVDEFAVSMSDCVNSITSIKSCKDVVDELGAPFVA